MTFVITDACVDTKEQSCLAVCPVDCIIEAERMFVIDASVCIDCGACESECPVAAITPDHSLSDDRLIWLELGRALVDGDIAEVNARVQELCPE
jgi:NAD-dependent dihydropyrimidine dehydrogenase PreA subunit